MDKVSLRIKTIGTPGGSSDRSPRALCRTFRPVLYFLRVNELPRFLTLLRPLKVGWKKVRQLLRFVWVILSTFDNFWILLRTHRLADLQSIVFCSECLHQVGFAKQSDEFSASGNKGGLLILILALRRWLDNMFSLRFSQDQRSESE